MKKLTLFLFLSFLLCSFETFAQKRSLQIGGKIINDFTLYNGYAPGFGGQIVYRMGKHGGIESGLYYESRYQAWFTTIQYNQTSYYYYTKIAERWLQLPLLYRYDSRFINFVAGPALDYFIGWKTKHTDPGVTVDNYDRNSVRIVGSAGISKSFNLSSTVILEPEIKFNYFPSEEDGGLLINISLRKKLY